MHWNSLFAVILNVAFFLAVGPLATGFLRWSKARLQKKRGPDILQPYRNLWKLWHIRPRQLDVPSWMFSMAPYINLLCYIIAAAFLPVIFLPSDSALQITALGLPSGDLIFLIYLLGLAKFAMGLAGMDSGSPFGHMGSSRSMFIHVILEPGLILCLAALALQWTTTDLSVIVIRTQDLGLTGVLSQPTLLLILLGLLVLALAESERLPFDSPATHLELTMTERAIPIEYEGRHLAAVEWAEMLKMLFLMTLIIDLFAPQFLTPLKLDLAGLLSPVAYLVKLTISVLILAGWELIQGQLRMREPIWPAAVASSLALASIAVNFTRMIH